MSLQYNYQNTDNLLMACSVKTTHISERRQNGIPNRFLNFSVNWDSFQLPNVIYLITFSLCSPNCNGCCSNQIIGKCLLRCHKPNISNLPCSVESLVEEYPIPIRITKQMILLTQINVRIIVFYVTSCSFADAYQHFNKKQINIAIKNSARMSIVCDMTPCSPVYAYSAMVFGRKLKKNLQH